MSKLSVPVRTVSTTVQTFSQISSHSGGSESSAERVRSPHPSASVADSNDAKSR